MEVEYRISNLLVRTAPCKNASRYTYLTVAYSHLNRSSVDGIAVRQRIDIFYDRPTRSQYGEGPIHIT